MPWMGSRNRDRKTQSVPLRNSSSFLVFPKILPSAEKAPGVVFGALADTDAWPPRHRSPPLDCAASKDVSARPSKSEGSWWSSGTTTATPTETRCARPLSSSRIASTRRSPMSRAPAGEVSGRIATYWSLERRTTSSCVRAQWTRRARCRISVPSAVSDLSKPTKTRARGVLSADPRSQAFLRASFNWLWASRAERGAGSADIKPTIRRVLWLRKREREINSALLFGSLPHLALKSY